MTYSTKKKLQSLFKKLGYWLFKLIYGEIKDYKPINNFSDTQIKKSQIIIKQDKSYFRPNEVHNLVGDYSKAKKFLNWKPKINFDQLISEMIESEIKNY